MSFIDDIGSQNTQLYPIVTIEGSSPTAGEDVVGGWIPALGEVILLSTNNVSLDHIYKNAYTAANPEGYAGYSQVNQRHFKPLLLNIPSIKESIDIESKKFKISSVSLDISNIEYEGKRFTDIFSDTSLINSIVSIQFVSPTAKMFSTIRPIINFNNTGQNNSYSFYQGYSDPMFEDDAHYGNPEIRAKMTQMVYQGVIRRISHDDTKVKIELEDLTAKKAHKDLPQALDQNGVVGELGSGDNILDRYKNKPIPIVYGHVDKAPTVIDGSSGSHKLRADSKPISIFNTQINEYNQSESPLWVENGNEKFNVTTMILSDFGLVDGINSLGDIPQFTEDLYESSITLSASNPLMIDNTGIQARYISKPSTVEIFDLPTSASSTSVETAFSSGTYNLFDELDIKNIMDGDASTSAERTFIETFDSGELDAGFVYNFQDVSHGLRFSSPPDFGTGAFVIQKIKINGTIIDTVNASNSPLFTGLEIIADESFDEFNGEIDYQNYSSTVGAVSIHLPVSDDSIGAFIAGTYHPYVQVMTIGKSFNIVWGWYGAFHVTTSGSIFIEQESNINISGLNINILGDVEKPSDREYFINLDGRINTDNAALGQRNNPNLGNLTLIENPIDIIYDLVRSELGHGAINQAEYLEAKAAHKYLDANNMPQDWKFGFAVNKKINSKKLIEDIAKSTKCFPKFKNDGTFGFNTIKDYYNAADISSASLIKESEVISYSFKKTKPEQIYKKITVSYDKDYAQDSYPKTALSEDLGDDPYYGIENSSDAHLEFESDYIRHDVDGGNTANALAQFLLWNYKNDHLVFNLKLPLQYINLEVGSLVKLNLFDGMRAFGIDYTVFHMVNGQYRLPVFMITSSTKNLNSVSIECMQLHDSGEYQAELDEQAAALAAELAAQAEADAAAAAEEAAEAAEEAIIMQPPVITITGGNQTYQAGAVFPLPTATAIDAIDGALPVTTSYSDSVVFINISSNLGVETAIAPNLDLNISIQVQFEATDSSNVTGYASTSINIVQHPSYNIFDMSVFDGYRTFAINGFHYGGEPETDISGLENAFWFLFYHDLDAITGNHFFQDTNYNKYVGGREIFKILQVNGLPNPNDNGLYYMAAEFVSAEDSGAFNDNFYNQYASASDPFDEGTTYISVYPNHQLCFQKINMTQNVYNPVTDTTETTIIGDYTNPVAGAWLTEPEVDNNHTMGANIFQDNVGAYWNGQMVNPENISGESQQYWVAAYVWPELPGGTPAAPLIIGGNQDIINTGPGGDYMPEQFVGGISMHETTSIELIDIPTEPIYNVEGILGDSNTDGFLNILDLVATVHFILGTGDLSTAGQILADSNQDNSLNILDIVGTVDTILGID